MKNCCNLYLLSTIACQLADCMSPEELAAFSTDLVLLGDMLANILATKAACETVTEDPCT